PGDLCGPPLPRRGTWGSLPIWCRRYAPLVPTLRTALVSHVLGNFGQDIQSLPDPDQAEQDQDRPRIPLTHGITPSSPTTGIGPQYSTVRRYTPRHDMGEALRPGPGLCLDAARSPRATPRRVDRTGAGRRRCRATRVLHGVAAGQGGGGGGAGPPMEY